MIVIIAPHPDDELIGCYEIIQNAKENIDILYSIRKFDSERYNEAKVLPLKFSDKIITQRFVTNFTNTIKEYILSENLTYYFPDPIYETHPIHRRYGAEGEILLRKGYDVIFYSTNMNAPYIHEVDDSKEKENLLNSIYPSQKDLWKFEKKYVLFEGRVKWLV